MGVEVVSGRCNDVLVSVGAKKGGLCGSMRVARESGGGTEAFNWWMVIGGGEGALRGVEMLPESFSGRSAGVGNGCTH